jgi:hypothetical protein
MYLLAARWLQVAHGALYVGMPEPLLDGAQIHARPKATGRKGRSELMEPEVSRVELCTFRYGFQAVEKVQFRLAARSREHQAAILVSFRLPSLQALQEL